MVKTDEGPLERESVSGGLPAVSREERDSLLAEVLEILSQPKQDGRTGAEGSDWFFGNCGFGLGIDPNG